MRWWTALILIAVTAALIVWDIVAIAVGGVEATISDVMLTWIQEHPVVPFLLGICCGHWCWPQRSKK